MINSSDKVMILGRSGCGKSFLAKKIQELWPRRIIIDSLHEYSDDVGHPVYSFDELSQLLIQYKNENKENFTIIFRFDLENDHTSVEFDQVLRILYYYGNILIVIEEIQTFSSVHNIPKWLKHLVLTGRHQNIAVMFTSQRPGEVHKTLLSQCQHIFVGTISEGNDLKYIASFLNQDAKKLSTLPDRRFLYFSREGVKEVSNEF